jgi:hypothetical protein
VSDYRDVSKAIGNDKQAQAALDRLMKAARAARRVSNRISEDEHRSATGRKLTPVARVYNVTPQFLRGIQSDVEEVRW